MRKIFTLFAAMLLTVAVNATGTDFAAPGYSCAADDAVLSGSQTKQGSYTEPQSNNLCLVTADPNYLAWKDVSSATDVAVATWTVTASRGCYVSVSLGLGAVIIDSNKHIFEVKIKDDKGNTKGTLAEPAENTDADQVKALDGTILIPQAGTYTVELRNTRNWGKGAVLNVILTYAADAPSEVIEVSSVTLNKHELGLEVEEVEQLTATVLPSEATDPSVTWESSDETVATVVDGFVTAIKAGPVKIIATAGEKKDTCEVTVSAVSIPSTDFSSDYVLSAKKAQLEGKIWKMYKDATYKLYGNGGDNKFYGTASWTIHVEKPCFVTGTLNGVEGGHMFALDLYQGNDSIGTIAQRKAKVWSAGNIALDSVGYSTLLFPAEGDYTLKLRNTQEWSSGKVESITLTLDESKVVKLKGSWDSWLAEQEFTLSADGLTATKTKSLNKNSEPEFKIWVGGDERANGCWFKRDVTSTTLPGSGSNMKIVTDYTGDYVLTWTFATNTLSITFPEPELENGWYLVGTFNGIDKWTVNDLSSTDKFGVNPANEDEFMIIKDLKKDDRFKAVYVYLDELQSDSWKPADGDGYVVTAGQAGDAKAIYFRVNYYDSWGGHFYITDSPSTSLDNVLDTDKTVKAIENGQLVIIKNGVRYNVIGSVIR